MYKIDVIIPVYNGEKYISKALDSVLAQSYAPRNIIVVNDGSNDNTENIITNYQKKYKSIIYHKKENGGPNSARNAGIAYTKSPFIAFLDADDEWYPQKLEFQIKCFKHTNFKNLGLVYCHYENIDENGNFSSARTVIPIDTTIRGFVFNKLINGAPITGSASAVLIKKICFEKVGLFDENLKAAEEGDMWMRINKCFEIDYINKVLVKIRCHNSNAQNNTKCVISNELIFFNKWLQFEPLKSKFVLRVCRNIIIIIIMEFPDTSYLNLVKNKFNKISKRKIICRSLLSLKLYILKTLLINIAVRIKHLTFNNIKG